MSDSHFIVETRRMLPVIPQAQKLSQLIVRKALQKFQFQRMRLVKIVGYVFKLCLFTYDILKLFLLTK